MTEPRPQYFSNNTIQQPNLNTLYKVYFGANNSAVKKLPNELQQNRKSTIDEAINYISSSEFFENKIEGKNWKDDEYLERIIKYSQDKQWLRRRADSLLNSAYDSLAKTFQNRNTIAYAWAGGRDSSALLATSLAFYPEKKYRLLTVLNGMSGEFDNPRRQFKRLLAKFETSGKEIDIKHYYVDKIDEIRKHTIETAKSDKAKLGCAAICSSCKMVIEKSLAKAAKQLGADNIMLGYSQYQGKQDWIEQTPQQIEFMKKALKITGITQESLLYDVLEYPFDADLLLSSLGIPRSEHKLEMKCKGGGLNPKDFDYEKLLEFLKYKNEMTDYITENPVSLIDDIEPEKRDYYGKLVPNVVQLRSDEEYRNGIFEERKYNGK